MAVAYDAISASNGTTSISWTHTPVGTPKGVVVWVNHFGTTTTDDVTLVTYGGQLMTLVATKNGDANLNGFACCYFLNSPASGAQTVLVTGGSATKRTFAQTWTAATNGTKVQTFQSTGPTSYTKNTTVNTTTLSLSAVSCACAGTFLTAQTAVGRCTPKTSWTSRTEYDWASNVSAHYSYDTVGTTDVIPGFVGSTDTGTGYYIAQTVAIAEGPGATRLSETATASDVVSTPQVQPISTLTETVTTSDVVQVNPVAIQTLSETATASDACQGWLTNQGPTQLQIISSTAASSTSGGSTAQVTVPVIETGDLVLALTVDSWQLANSTPTATGLSFTAILNYDGAGSYGSVSAWKAIAGSGATDLVVSYTETGDTVAMCVLVIKNYSGDFTSTANKITASTTDASQSITRQGTNSWVFGCAQGYTSSANGSPVSGTTELADLPDPGPTYFNSQIFFRTTSPGTGSVTVGETWSAAQDTVLLLVEIKQRAVGSLTETATPSDESAGEVTGGGPPVSTLSESSTITDAVDSLQGMVAVGSETATASDTSAGVVQSPVAVVGELSETATASDGAECAYLYPKDGVGMWTNAASSLQNNTDKFSDFYSGTVCGYFYAPPSGPPGIIEYNIIQAVADTGGSELFWHAGHVVHAASNFESTSTFSLTPGGWHFFALVNSGTTVSGYVAPVGTDLSTAVTDSISLGKTASSFSAMIPSNGFMARLRAWNGVLSLAELNAERVSGQALKSGALFDISFEYYNGGWGSWGNWFQAGAQGFFSGPGYLGLLDSAISVTPGDDASTTVKTSGRFTETATASDTSAGSVVGAVPESQLSETVTSTVSFEASVWTRGALTETSTATDTVSATQVVGIGQTDTATPLDTYAALQIMAASLSETSTVTDTVAGIRTGPSGSIVEGTLAEVATAQDIVTVLQKYAASLSETLTTYDIVAPDGVASAAATGGGLNITNQWFNRHLRGGGIWRRPPGRP